MATKTSRGRTPPPRRGVPYYDARTGKTMILPREGGAARVHEPRQPEEWTARKALRRSGVRTARAAADAGDRAARKAPAVGRAVFGPTIETSSDAGNLALYVFVSIIGLAILGSALGGRGPKAVSIALGWLTGAVTKLVSASDPIISQGSKDPQPTTAATGPASTNTTTGTAAATKPASSAGSAANTRADVPSTATTH